MTNRKAARAAEQPERTHSSARPLSPHARSTFFDRWVPYLAVLIVGIFCVAAIGGCLSAPKRSALSALECRARLLEPYLGDMTHDLMRAALAGNASPLVQALDSLGLTPSEIADVSRAWHACSPKKPSAVGNQPDAGPPLVEASL